LGAVRADDELHIAGNLIAGRGLPHGVDDCAAPDCAGLAARNELSVPAGIFRAPERGDLRLGRGYRDPAPELPARPPAAY
jgi:hypothetical protein